MEEVFCMDNERDPFLETEQVASMTECTGLMPVLPADAQQDASYAALYAIHDARRKPKKKK